MHLSTLDIAVIAAVMIATALVGLLTTRRGGTDPEQFFLSGRGMSGWMLGLSMVATTFAADTPGLVTELVRTHGVAGNWSWWAFLLTGMLTVFLFAKLWRRSRLNTDLEFYELRYGGQPALALRVFRALYLGVVFNVIVMAVVSVAAIKIGQVMLGVPAYQVLLCGGLLTLILSATGGFRAVVISDCLLFAVAIAGAVAAAYFALSHPSVGGLERLLTQAEVREKMAWTPAWDWSSAESRDALMTLLLTPLLIQWWSVWYPGAEPGGGGYLAQRMLAAKNENHAVGAALVFNAIHYAVRPWPWVLVALASVIVFPEVADIQAAFPAVDKSKLGDDLAYPAMLTLAPSGWRGVIVASLLAAYVSTISTHLNWGASYVTGDFYQRLVAPDASPKQLVLVGRVSTVVMILLASLLTYGLETAKSGFDLILSIGAGTGLIYVLRWYWWRINAYSEIAAMVASVSVACYFQLGSKHGLEAYQVLALSVGITTAIWLAVALLTRPESSATLENFYRLVRPAGPGWAKVREAVADEDDEPASRKPDPTLMQGLTRMALGCGAIYSALFAVGEGLYQRLGACLGWASISLIAALLLLATYRRRSTAGAPSS